ncbi:MAG: SCO family protein [Proteobacteria bacterium]|nr:SCO family protein [Pseudomonadota bacterium]
MRAAAAARAGCTALGLSLLACAAGSAVAAVDPLPAAAPRLQFTPLPAGSYRLWRIQPVADATLLDEHGQPIALRAVTRGKITLFTFFYTYCMDPLGCPFVRETLQALRERILTDHALAAAVRFVAVSCDPGNDTPPVLRRYAADFQQPGFEWRFLTAPDVATLLPVLEDFGQDVSVDVDALGRPTRTLHHMLKVFLIDPHGEVREIYSLAFLQPPVLFNDIRTLYLERRSAAAGYGR